MIRSVLGSRASIGGVLGSGRGGAGNGLLTGLVAYWGLDEASGNALDKHSGGLTLAQVNSPGSTTGQVYATARTFNGSSQYFERASETALQTGNIDFAVALWVYATAGDVTQVLMAKGAVALGEEEFSILVAAGPKFILEIGNSARQYDSIATASTYTLGQWHLVIAYHDAATSTLAISVDGGAPTTKNTARNPEANTRTLRIGSADPVITGYYANGRIGPVAFWKNRTLDATAVAALWNGGAGLAYSAFS